MMRVVNYKRKYNVFYLFFFFVLDFVCELSRICNDFVFFYIEI